jgi:ubiquinone/menaquinone biosynthesis C-methylase UbiE
MKRVLEPEVMDEIEEAEAYDGMVAGRQGELLLQCFAYSALNLGVSSGRLLDIGTGSGRIPINIARLCPDLDITAVDMSESMLSVAQKNSEASGTDNQIEFKVADAKQLPFPDNTFDLVISHVTLHHIPNPLSMLKEVNRVLKPGGGVLIRDLKRPSNPLMLSLYVNIFGKDTSKFQRKLYRDSLKAGFSLKEFQQMAIDSGIPEARVARNFITHLSIEKFANFGIGAPKSHFIPSLKDKLTNMMYKQMITKPVGWPFKYPGGHLN